MDMIVELLIIGIILVLFICIFWKVIKKLLVNSLIGIILILVLNLVFQVDIPLTPHVMVAVALFGLPGVGTMLILHVGGLI